MRKSSRFQTSCMAAQVDNEDLVLTLEAIVEKFEDEMAPFAVGLTQHLAAAFWRATAAEVPIATCQHACCR